jgi:hypothetical protein
LLKSKWAFLSKPMKLPKRSQNLCGAAPRPLTTTSTHAPFSSASFASNPPPASQPRRSFALPTDPPGRGQQESGPRFRHDTSPVQPLARSPARSHSPAWYLVLVETMKRMRFRIVLPKTGYRGMSFVYVGRGVLWPSVFRERDGPRWARDTYPFSERGSGRATLCAA